MKSRKVTSLGAVLLMSIAGLAMTGPAAAQPGLGNGKAVGRPADGMVGNSQVNSRQTDYFAETPNNGWRCDFNHGVGQGNPAHPYDCDGGGDEEIPE